MARLRRGSAKARARRRRPGVRVRRALGFAIAAAAIVGGGAEGQAADPTRPKTDGPTAAVGVLFAPASASEAPVHGPQLPKVYLPYPAGTRWPLGRGPGGYTNEPPPADGGPGPFHWKKADRFDIDILMPTGSQVVAAAPGRVIHAKGDCEEGKTCDSPWGNSIAILHANGTTTVYAHLQSVGVKPGDVVGQGQAIAKSNNTGNSFGPHLHFGVHDARGLLRPSISIPFEIVELGGRPIHRTPKGQPGPRSLNAAPEPPRPSIDEHTDSGGADPDDREPFVPPPGGGGGASPNVSSSAPTVQSSDLGGVDLSQVTLRYLGVPRSGPLRGISYVVRAPRGRRAEGVTAAQAVSSASDSFFVWLALPTRTFTANLNPAEPERIMDARLARTEAGRALLEADLEMKKTVARLIHPDTRTGAAIWRDIGASGAGARSCFSFRQWITPARATVAATADAVYVVRAPLRVQLENEYLGSGAGRARCGSEQARSAAAVEAAYRRLVLPRVERAVNTAPEYAALRRAYASRIAAEWYRRRDEPGPYDEIVDSGEIEPWRDAVRWSPRDVYVRYLRSLRDGEFDIRRRERRGRVVATHVYVYGGVDFTRILLRTIAPAVFGVEVPDAVEDLLRALVARSAVTRTGAWFGASALDRESLTRGDQGSGGHAPAPATDEGESDGGGCESPEPDDRAVGDTVVEEDDSRADCGDPDPVLVGVLAIGGLGAAGGGVVIVRALRGRRRRADEVDWL